MNARLPWWLNTKNRDKMQQTGFSLIELLIVMALIGILSAITYPSYLNPRQRTQGQQANIGLHRAATRLEKHAMLHGSYLTATREQLGLNDLETSTAYHYHITQLSAHHFQLTATAQQPHQDDQCNHMIVEDKSL